MHKTIARILVGGTLLAGGGSVAIDASINPYTDVQETLNGKSVPSLQIQREGTLPEEGKATTIVNTDRPRIELDKWDGEVKLGITSTDLPTDAAGARPFLSKNVEWGTGAISMEAVPLDPAEGMEDGGMEININLASEPTSNVFTFQLDSSQNLDFAYQPPLWQEAGLKAPTADCADTDCTTAERTSHRPDNAVGSFAIYYKNHANHIEGQTNYATGKAYHIFRPLVTDANGVTAWADLSYANGALSVTVPQTFLDSATYPVKVDPTFGYTTQGASQLSFGIGTNKVASVVSTYTASSGDTVTSYSFWGNFNDITQTVNFAAFTVVAGVVTNQLAAKVGVSVTSVTNQLWTTATISQSPVAGTNYAPAISGEDCTLTHGIFLDFDLGSTPGRFNSTSNSFPGAGGSFSPTGTDSGTHYSFYATYTASGGVATPAAQNYIKGAKGYIKGAKGYVQ